MEPTAKRLVLLELCLGPLQGCLGLLLDGFRVVCITPQMWLVASSDYHLADARVTGFFCAGASKSNVIGMPSAYLEFQLTTGLELYLEASHSLTKST